MSLGVSLSNQCIQERDDVSHICNFKFSSNYTESKKKCEANCNSTFSLTPGTIMFQYIVYIEILMGCFTFFTLKKNLVRICHTPTLSHSESATAQSPAAHGAQAPTADRVRLCHSFKRLRWHGRL